MNTPTPPQLKDYRFEDLLGEGSFGWVWRTVYRGSQQRAVKVFKRNRVDIGVVDRELAKLQLVREHSGIVLLHDFDLTGDMPYYAMSLHAERVPGVEGQPDSWRGRTLEPLCGAVSMQETVRLLRQIADALAYLHTHRVIHCDVKPSNVLLTDESPPHVKLCDFGQSRSSASVLLEVSGTPFYAPPEQLRHPEQSGPDEKGAVRGYRWDVYSFGVLAYKLATGKLPRLEELAEAYRKAAVGDVSLLPPSLVVYDHIPSSNLAEMTEQEGEKIEWPGSAKLGAEERAIIEKCLRLDPQERFGDMEEVKAAFANVENERKLAEAKRVAELAHAAEQNARMAAEQARRRAAIFRWAAGIVGVLAVLAFIQWRQADKERDAKIQALSVAEQEGRAKEEALKEKGKALEDKEAAFEQAKKETIAKQAALERAEGETARAEKFLKLAEARNQEASEAAMSNGKQWGLMEDDNTSAGAAYFAKALHYRADNMDARMALACLVSFEGVDLFPPLPREVSAFPGTPVTDHFSSVGPALVVPFRREEDLAFYDVQKGTEMGKSIPPYKLESASVPPSCLHLARDGRNAVIQMEDTKAVRVWSIQEGQWLGEPVVHPFELSEAFLADGGTRMATTDIRGTARLWSMPDGKCLAEVRHSQKTDLSRDGHHWVVTMGGKAELRDGNTGALKRSLSILKEGWMGFSESGKYCVARSAKDEESGMDIVTIWETTTGKAEATATATDAGLSTAVFAPDETRVLLSADGGSGSDYQVLPLEDGAFVPEASSRYGSLAFHPQGWSPDGLRFIAGTAGDSMKEAWAGEDWALPWSLHGTPLLSLPTSSPATLSRVTSRDQGGASLEVWDTYPRAEPGLLLPMAGELVWASCSADGNRVLTVGKLDASTSSDGEGTMVPEMVRISADGRRAAAENNGSFLVWDLATGGVIFNQELAEGETAAEDGNMERVAIATKSGVTICSPGGSGEELKLAYPDGFPGGDVSPLFVADGKWLELTSFTDVEPGDTPPGVVLLLPDTNALSSATPDRRLFDKKTLHDLLGLDAREVTVKLNEDGHWAWSVDMDHQVRCWDVAARKALGAAFSPEDAFQYVLFSDDGARALLVSNESGAQQYDTRTGKAIGQRLEPLERRDVVQYHPNGRWITTGSFAWDAQTGQPLGVQFGGSPDIEEAMITENGAWGVTLDPNGVVQRWDLLHGKKAGAAWKVEEAGRSFLFALSENGQWVELTHDGENGAASFIFDAATGVSMDERLKHELPVIQSQLHVNDLLSLDEKGTVRVWRGDKPQAPALIIETGEPTAQWEVVEDWLLMHGKDVSTAWSLKTGARLGGAKGQFTSISEVDAWLITQNLSNEIQVWNAASGRLMSMLKEPGQKKELARAEAPEPNNVAIVWDLTKGEPVGPSQSFSGASSSYSFGAMESAVLSPDGNTAVVALQDHSVRIWDVPSGKMLPQAVTHESGEAMPIELSSDGSLLATAIDEKTVRLWKVKTGEAHGEPMTHEGQVMMARFTTDGRQLITVGLDKNVRFWETATGKASRPPLDMGEPLARAAFSTDGKLLALSGESHVWLWRWQTQEKPESLVTEASLGKAGSGDFEIGLLKFAQGDQLLLAAGKTNLVVWRTLDKQFVRVVPGAERVEGEAYYLGQDLPVSTDGQWLVVPTDSGGTGVFSLSSGEPVGAMQDLLDIQERSLGTLVMSPKTGWVISGSRCGVRARRFPDLGPPVAEDWLQEAIAMLSGKGLNARQQLEDLSVEERLKLREKFASLPQDSLFSRQVAWSLADRRTRSLWPGGNLDVPQGVMRLIRHQQELRRSGKAYDVKAADQVLREAYVMDPDHPLVHIAIAATIPSKKQSEFLRDYDLKRLPDSCAYAKSLNAADVCATAAEMCLEQGDAARAREAAQKALALDANHERAKQVLAKAGS